MPVVRAIANGNWSATSTWNGGVLPGNGDTVVANGFTVTIDQNVTIGGANNPSVNAGSFVTGQWYQITTVGTTAFTTIGASSNTVGVTFQATGAGAGTGVATALATITTAAIAAASAGAGGGFNITTAFTLAADIRAGTTVCVTLTGTSNVTWTPVNIIGGSTTNAHGIQNNATAGTLSIPNCYFDGGNGTTAHGLNNALTGSLSISGSTFFSNGGSGSSSGVFNASTGSISISSSIITGSNGSNGTVCNSAGGSISVSGSTISGSSTAIRVGLVNNAGGTITVTASTLTGGTAISGADAATNRGTGVFSITGSTFNASSVANAFTGGSTSASVTLQGSQYDHLNGTVAVYCAKYKIGTTPSLMQYRKALDGTSTYLTLYTTDFSYFGNPATTDVRNGVSFGSGLTGTAYIPSAASVAYGVPVDATTGTAVLTPSAVQAALLPLL